MSNKRTKNSSGQFQKLEPSKHNVSTESHWQQVLYFLPKSGQFEDKIRKIYIENEFPYDVRCQLGESFVENVSIDDLKQNIDSSSLHPQSKEVINCYTAEGLVEVIQQCLRQEKLILESAMEIEEEHLDRLLASKVEFPCVREKIRYCKTKIEEAEVLSSGQLDQQVILKFGKSIELIKHNLTKIWHFIWTEITKYRNVQKMWILNDETPKDGLAMLNEFSCAVGDIAKRLYKLVDKTNIPSADRDSVLVWLKDEFLTDFLQMCLVIDNNPPQIIRLMKERNTKKGEEQKKSEKAYPLSLWLLGYSSIIDEVLPLVKVGLYDENDLDENLLPLKGKEPVSELQFTQNNSKKEQSHIVINRSKAFSTLGVEKLCASSNVTVCKFRRPVRASEEGMVTDTNYVIVFEVKINSERLGLDNYVIRTATLPMTFVCQSSQHWHPTGKHIWNASFDPGIQGTDNRCPNRYVVQPAAQVDWSMLERELINPYIYKRTGKMLPPEQLAYLKNRMFNNTDVFIVDKDVFLKSPMCDTKDKSIKSLWHFIYLSANLLKRFKKEWQANIIYGFISKDSVRAKLGDKSPGTFLLRIRESSAESNQSADRCAELSVSLVAARITETQILHSHMDAMKKNESLASYLRKMEVKTSTGPHQLELLFPNIPLELALEDFPDETSATKKHGNYYGMGARSPVEGSSVWSPRSLCHSDVSTDCRPNSQISFSDHPSNPFLSPRSTVEDLDDVLDAIENIDNSPMEVQEHSTLSSAEDDILNQAIRAAIFSFPEENILTPEKM